MDAFSLSGRTCVLTGAVGLLGREFADVLCERGARLVVTDRSQIECEELARALADRHPGALVLACAADISNATDVTALARFVVERCGVPHGLVNNAAIDDKFDDAGAALFESSFEHYPLARWQRMLDVNVTGTFLCCQALGSLMAERGEASIVNVASTYGLVAPQQALYRDREGRQAFWKGAAYPTTKSAVIGLSRYLASYWGHRGVRVNTLCPGGVKAGQAAFFVDEYERRTPLGRMASPGDYRAALAFLLSDASSYMTGHDLVVDGGWTAW